MKICTTEHVNKRFGDTPIPKGSLWEDDSPFADDKHFADVAELKKKESR